VEALLTFVWRFVLELWPWTIVDVWELALRVRLGKRLRKLKPGLRVSLPFVDHIITEPATLKTINLTDQPVSTADGTSVNLGGVIFYYVRDLQKLWLKIDDYEETLSNLALTALASQIEALDYSDCAIGKIERRTRTTLRRAAKPWGIHIERFGLTSLCESQVIHLVAQQGSQSIVLGTTEE